MRFSPFSLLSGQTFWTLPRTLLFPAFLPLAVTALLGGLLLIFLFCDVETIADYWLIDYWKMAGKNRHFKCPRTFILSAFLCFCFTKEALILSHIGAPCLVLGPVTQDESLSLGKTVVQKGNEPTREMPFVFALFRFMATFSGRFCLLYWKNAAWKELGF